jgi:hypothetical protein
MKTKTSHKTLIGDGKLPNLYWVSLSNDYLYLHDGNCLDWIGDLLKDGFKSIGKTFDMPFDTYKAAKEFCDGLYLGMPFENFIINRINIEDRLSGELYEKTKVFNLYSGKITEQEYATTRYTEKAMKESGCKFE